MARGQLALDVVAERLALLGIPTIETRFDLIGVNAVHRGPPRPSSNEPAEVRARVCARTETREAAVRVGHEVTALWLNGPAGGAGAVRTATEVIAIASVLLPRAQVPTRITMMES